MSKYIFNIKPSFKVDGKLIVEEILRSEEELTSTMLSDCLISSRDFARLALIKLYQGESVKNTDMGKMHIM